MLYINHIYIFCNKKRPYKQYFFCKNNGSYNIINITFIYWDHNYKKY